MIVKIDTATLIGSRKEQMDRYFVGEEMMSEAARWDTTRKGPLCVGVLDGVGSLASATTISAVVIKDDVSSLCAVGDSPAYLWRSKSWCPSLNRRWVLRDSWQGLQEVQRTAAEQVECAIAALAGKFPCAG